jgi:hypothetical protein
VVLLSAASFAQTNVIFPIRGKNEVPSGHLYPFAVNSREPAIPFNDEPYGESGVAVSGSGLPWEN